MSIDTTETESSAEEREAIEAMVRASLVPIVDDVFTAMVTGEPGTVWEVGPGTFTFTNPIHSWVGVTGGITGRALLTTEHSTADEIARALLHLDADKELSEEDFEDAVGELANVVGGNVKSLLPDKGTMTLPTVSTELPATEAEPFHVAEIDWMGRGIRITLWVS